MDELKKLPRKATEDSFNELHYLVTEDFLHRIKRRSYNTRFKSSLRLAKTTITLALPTVVL